MLSNSLVLASYSDWSALGFPPSQARSSSALSDTDLTSSAESAAFAFSSVTDCLPEYSRLSSWFLASIFFLILSSSSLKFSASWTSLSISSLERRPFSFLIWMLLLIPLLFFFEVLGFLDEFVDFVFGEAAFLVFDLDVVTDTLALLNCFDIQNAIGINVECDFDLRLPSWHWRDTLQIELTEQVVVLGHLSLTFLNLDAHSRLVVCLGSESL